jgi:hypothetical protein
MWLLSFLLWASPRTFAQPPDKECLTWFNRAKIASDSKDCELKCGALMTDMGTFMCPDQCDLLCKVTASDSIFKKLVYYPGLTPAEKRLAKKNPGDALTDYIQKTRAELSTGRNFPAQGLSDESDAFRHIIWAALLTKELGQSKAKEFLEAHEADPDQADNEREMDLHNNTRGQAAAEKLMK